MDEGKSKVLTSGKMPTEGTAKAGGMSTSGPTGSSRSYAKGGAPKMNPMGFNPMNGKVSPYPGPQG